MKSTRVHRHI